MKILILYDGSLDSKVALKYGIRKAAETGGRLFALSVFNSNMFIDYGAGPGAVERARGESARHLEDAGKIIAESGTEIQAGLVAEEGDPEAEAVNFARAEKVDLIIVAPRYKSVVKRAPCPVSVVPGNILLPVDNTESCLTVLDRVVYEARETGSKVIVLGIVPIHIYSSVEKKETDRLKKETEAVSKKVKKLLLKDSIDVREILRAGYPDEEIVKVADEYPVAMIIVPQSGETVSELAKAANIIMDEPERLKKPVLLVTPVRGDAQ